MDEKTLEVKIKRQLAMDKVARRAVSITFLKSPGPWVSIAVAAVAMYVFLTVAGHFSTGLQGMEQLVLSKPFINELATNSTTMARFVAIDSFTIIALLGVAGLFIFGVVLIFALPYIVFSSLFNRAHRSVNTGIEVVKKLKANGYTDKEIEKYMFG